MNGVERIAKERRRQVEVEGWTPEHDAEHRTGQLARAASMYAIPPGWRTPQAGGLIEGSLRLFTALWPWPSRWWKPTPYNRIRELEKAGALIAAEIDRILRADHTEGTP